VRTAAFLAVTAALATYLATGCTPLPYTHDAAAVHSTSAVDTPFRLSGTCDIAVRGSSVRTALQVIASADSLSAACVDEMGVTLVLVSVGPGNVSVARWFPPLRSRHARLVGVGVYGLETAMRLEGADDGVYSRIAGDQWVDVLHSAGGADTVYVGTGNRTTHCGVPADSVFALRTAEGDTALVVRW
jgi:hypothetical protein